MIFLELTEFLTAILVVVIFVTQIFIPLWVGGKLFPFCRKKLKRLDEEIAEAKEDVDIALTERKVRRMKKTAFTLRKEDEEEEEPYLSSAEHKPRKSKHVNPRKDTAE